VEVVKGRKSHASGGAGACSVCCFHVRLHLLAAWYLLSKRLFLYFISVIFDYLEKFEPRGAFLSNYRLECDTSAEECRRGRHKNKPTTKASKTTRVAVEEDTHF
jgi:hypothetical protein